MIFSSACALESYFTAVNEYSDTSLFESALIYGYVPEDLEDALNEIFPENQVFAEPANNNYFGVPARGVIGAP